MRSAKVNVTKYAAVLPHSEALSATETYAVTSYVPRCLTGGESRRYPYYIPHCNPVDCRRARFLREDSDQ